MLNGIRFLIRGTAPYSQSRQVFEKKREKENHDQLDERVWRLKAHADEKGRIIIPAHGIHQAIVLGAQKGRLVPSAAKSAREGLANRLTTGIMLLDNAVTNVTIEDAHMIAIQANSDGKRGSGKRVTRRFPEWNNWTATFDVLLLDDTLTLADLQAAVRWAGLVAGLGRFRAAQGGSNGRFIIEKVDPFEFSDQDFAKQAA